MDLFVSKYYTHMQTHREYVACFILIGNQLLFLLLFRCSSLHLRRREPRMEKVSQRNRFSLQQIFQHHNIANFGSNESAMSQKPMYVC